MREHLQLNGIKFFIFILHIVLFTAYYGIDTENLFDYQ